MISTDNTNKEEDLGINIFLKPDIKGFNGIIKYRPEVFLLYYLYIFILIIF